MKQGFNIFHPWNFPPRLGGGKCVLLSRPILWKELECGSDWWWCWLDSRLTKTSYCILMRWQPLKLVGGSGGTNSCSDFQSSVLPTLILPLLTAASSLLSVSITLFLVMYWIVWNNTNVENKTSGCWWICWGTRCIAQIVSLEWWGYNMTFQTHCVTRDMAKHFISEKMTSKYPKHNAEWFWLSLCLCCSAFPSRTHLCEAAPGPLDGDLALVVDGGPDVDGLAGHVTSSVQPHTTRDWARGETRHAQLVLYLTVERLLKI